MLLIESMKINGQLEVLGVDGRIIFEWWVLDRFIGSGSALVTGFCINDNELPVPRETEPMIS
jgi:hypothetical protein